MTSTDQWTPTSMPKIRPSLTLGFIRTPPSGPFGARLVGCNATTSAGTFPGRARNRAGMRTGPGGA